MDIVANQKSSNRLVVLVSECMANNTDLARAIYWMAEPNNFSVLYLVYVDNSNNLLKLSRTMATMKAVTSSNKLSVEVRTTKTGQWLDTLNKIIRPNDVIICQKEQTVINSPFKTIPLSEFISAQIDLPVQTMAGYYHPIQMLTKKWFHELFALLGFLLIMALFTWFQVQLDQALDGFLVNIYFVITLLLEIGAFWAWYKFAFR